MTADVSARVFGGGRVTQQRRRIARAADRMRGAFTVDDLAEAVRISSRGPTAASGATATVYRAVAAMERSGYLSRVGTRDGSTLFAHCTHPDHHHHIICDGCGRIAPTPCPLGALDLSATRGAGFVVTRHEVTMYGLCSVCAADDGKD